MWEFGESVSAVAAAGMLCDFRSSKSRETQQQTSSDALEAPNSERQTQHFVCLTLCKSTGLIRQTGSVRACLLSWACSCTTWTGPGSHGLQSQEAGLL